MSICNGCGGVVGRDCFNPSECEWIAQDMERREAMRQAESVARDAAREAMNAGRAEISLRGSLAIAAMQSDLACCGLVGRDVDHVAEMAYYMADAMLRARTQDASHE